MCDLPGPIPYLLSSLTRLRWGTAVGASEYSLEISQDNGESWTILTKPINGTNVTLPKLFENKDYAFRVRGNNSCGYGSYSPIAYRRSPASKTRLDQSWIAAARSEPALQPGNDGQFLMDSGLRIMDVNDLPTVSFKNNTQISGILIISRDAVTMTTNSDSSIVIHVPKNSIIMGNVGTNRVEERATIDLQDVVVSKKAVKKTFVENESGRSYVLDDDCLDGFSKAGFMVANVQTGLNVQMLRKNKLVNEKGVFEFRLTHIVSGMGYANVYLTTQTAKTASSRFVMSRLVSGPMMTATQNGNNVEVYWVSFDSVSTLWRKINNGPWTMIAKTAIEQSTHIDHNMPKNATYCYSAGSSPNQTRTACVFMKSI